MSKPELITQYRSIRLCNTSYKILSKILVARIEHLMPHISPLQGSFTHGRRCTDNIILVQETMHFIHKSKHFEVLCAIKIDLEKTYGRLEWGFTKKILEFFRFPLEIVYLTTSCVSSASMVILINGEPSDWLEPSRNINRETSSPHTSLFFAWINFL